MLVSIITPTYNHEKYIAKCIESVLAQTYTQWEIIVVDDGSTDNTGEIVKGYSQRYPNIHYYYQKNKGLIKLRETYNFALSQAKGECIAILEGDDYWYSDKLAKQVEVLRTNPEVVFVWSKVDVVQEDDRKVSFYPLHYSEARLKYYNNENPAGILNVFLEDFPVPLSWMMRKSVLDKLGGFQQTEGMPTIDIDTMYALSLLGKFRYIHKELGAYRRSIHQATRKLTIQITQGSCQIAKSFYLGLPDTIKAGLDIDLNEIERRSNKHMSIAYSRYGRSCLVRKEYKEAQKSYLESLKGDLFAVPGWKIRSLLGLLFAYLKMDVEGLAKMLGKKSYT